MAEQALRSLVGRLREASAPAGLSDAELLRRWSATRDESAFELLVWRHGRLVWAACRRVLPDRHDAEDAFQATFLLLVRRASSIREGQALPAWLHTTATRAALAARGKKRAEPAAMDDVPAAPEADRDALAVVDEEVAALPERFRAAFVLCELMGLSVEEAAARLGCPVGTAASRLGRARQKLRERLTRRGLGPTPPSLTLPVLPAALPGLTLNAAVSMAAGSAATPAIAPGAAALVSEVLNAMFLTKLKLALAAGVAAVVIGVGGLHAFQYVPASDLEAARMRLKVAADEVARLEKAAETKSVLKEFVRRPEASKGVNLHTALGEMQRAETAVTTIRAGMDQLKTLNASENA
ncbi:MAG: RNA polymerase sigma factor, partial [Gemmataceae bacterium]